MQSDRPSNQSRGIGSSYITVQRKRIRKSCRMAAVASQEDGMAADGQDQANAPMEGVESQLDGVSSEDRQSEETMSLRSEGKEIKDNSGFQLPMLDDGCIKLWGNTFPNFAFEYRCLQLEAEHATKSKEQFRKLAKVSQDGFNLLCNMVQAFRASKVAC